MKTSVVIGAGYGDEGKGRTVCDLATPDSVVVRFNGGAQAGHTVVHAGRRHVFSHFGAGTFKGSSTVLAREFVCHPRLFLREWEELGTAPLVRVNPLCPVTTVYDVLINLMAERARGAGRHGSVGVGFGETVERHERGMGIRVAEIATLSDAEFAKRLRAIRDEWLPKRCAELGFDPADPDVGGMFAETLRSSQVIEVFIDECRAFLNCVDVADFAFDSEDLIFEGAQGLMLDMEIGCFPHVTRSHCGLRNVRALTDRPLEVHYITRAYTTRHGAGPLPEELGGAPYRGIRDGTNTYNESQEGLRFSYLNLDTLHAAIAADFADHGSPDMRVEGVMTCMDQLPERVHFIRDGQRHACAAKDLVDAFAELEPIGKVRTTWAP